MESQVNKIRHNIHKIVDKMFIDQYGQEYYHHLIYKILIPTFDPLWSVRNGVDWKFDWKLHYEIDKR